MLMSEPYDGKVDKAKIEPLAFLTKQGSIMFAFFTKEHSELQLIVFHIFCILVFFMALTVLSLFCMVKICQRIPNAQLETYPPSEYDYKLTTDDYYPPSE